MYLCICIHEYMRPLAGAALPSTHPQKCTKTCLSQMYTYAQEDRHIHVCTWIYICMCTSMCEYVCKDTDTDTNNNNSTDTHLAQPPPRAKDGLSQFPQFHATHPRLLPGPAPPLYVTNMDWSHSLCVCCKYVCARSIYRPGAAHHREPIRLTRVYIPTYPNMWR